MSKKHLFLIDAYGFLFRAYFSMPPLTRKDGTPVGAVLGFTNMLLKLKKNIEESHATSETDHYVAVIFDSGKKTFRNDMYPEYKANRPPAPEDLIPQFDLIRHATKAMNMVGMFSDGYEADDLIATYTRIGKEAGMKVTIISSDKDLMQLVDDRVSMYDDAKDRRIEAKEVEEKFGVPPGKVLDVLALMGDSSDNVPGVPGIGPKTATELIQTYGDLETLLERAGEVKQNKRRESLIEFADQARLSKELITLCETVPVEMDVEELAIKQDDPAQLLEFLREQEFKALISRVEKQIGETDNSPPSAPEKEIAPAEAVEENYTLITTKKDLVEWLKPVDKKIAIWLEEEKGNPVGISLASTPGKACYVPVTPQSNNTSQGTLDFLSEANDNQKPGISIIDFTSAINQAIKKGYILTVGHNIKSIIRRIGIDFPSAIADVMVVSYVLDGAKTKHALPTIVEQQLNVDLTIPENVLPAKTVLSEIPQEKIAPFIARKADCILRLNDIYQQRLFDEHMLNIYETIERPMIKVLTHMEKDGVKVDATILKKMSEDLGNRISDLEKDIHSLAGEEFNIGSPKQLGEVLFEHMGIQGSKKSKKSGSYSTGADVLEELSVQGHTIAEKILHWRQLSKLKSTYTDALPNEINKSTGRVHTTYGMTVTSTGRLSSLNPNLQNIPVRTEEGRKIRAAFIAEKGNKLISADYSQIELRLLASLADIKELKQAFANGVDVHSLTASQVFGVPLDKIESEHRYRAKAINFGIIYGQSAFGLAAGLGISRGEAKEYIDAYFKQYPGILEYMETTKEFAREHGYVQTIYGRKCFVPGINMKGPQKAFAERAAINAPLQGGAADIIKRAMIRLDKELPGDARMILQIHDELLVEAPENSAEKIAILLKNIMESASTCDVPFIVEANIGDNWGDIH